MSICTDKNNDKDPGSLKILRHIKKADTPMHDVRDLMVKILRQYQAVDKVGRSLGVLDKQSSFSDHVSWCSLVGKIDQKKEILDEAGKSQLVETLEYLGSVSDSIGKKVIREIQQLRDKWMRKVLLIDFSVVLLLAALVALMLFWTGVKIDKQMLINVVEIRPIFYTLSTVIVVSLVYLLHQFVRKTVINNMLDKNLGSLMPGMSLSKALLLNTRGRHSVFRPVPVGWNFLQKIRLAKARSKIEKMRQQMIEVLDHYPSKKAAD